VPQTLSVDVYFGTLAVAVQCLHALDSIQSVVAVNFYLPFAV